MFILCSLGIFKSTKFQIMDIKKIEIKETSQIGTEVLEFNHALGIGISINNSYFKEENLRKLIAFGSEYFPSRIYIMIPDEPMVATLIALGKTQPEAERVSRLKSNALANKCLALEKELGADITIIRWKEVVANGYYSQFLIDLNKYFIQDLDFRMDVRQVTTEVLLNSNTAVSEANLEIGAQFLLKELAFILMSNRILGEEKTAYVYHKTMDVLKKAIELKYSFSPDPNVGFITAE